MNKRGAELSINVIILAALGVLVLLILIAVFSRNIGQTTKKLENTGTESEKIRAILTSAGISPATYLNTNINDINKDLAEKGIGGQVIAVNNTITMGKDFSKCINISNSTEAKYLCLS
ncbi:MAG: hypothetical protein QXR30_02565 [Candidatus Woesearchaeota archaeon]